jgi:hypothetical protein
MSKQKRKITKPEKPIKAFIEPVSARNSETGHDELYFVFDGQRIAKRGYPGTPQAGTWVPLVEGLTYIGDFIGDELPDDGSYVGEAQLMPEPKGVKQ